MDSDEELDVLPVFQATHPTGIPHSAPNNTLVGMGVAGDMMGAATGAGGVHLMPQHVAGIPQHPQHPHYVHHQQLQNGAAQVPPLLHMAPPQGKHRQQQPMYGHNSFGSFPTKIPSEQQYALRSEHPVKPNLMPYMTIDLKARDVLPSDYAAGLSKPTISHSGRNFLVGTNNMKIENEMTNRLVFGILKDYIDSHKVASVGDDEHSEDNVTLFTYAVNEHVRDLEWLHNDERRIVVALNNHLGMVLLNEDVTNIENIVLFPNFHTDTIRQLCSNPSNEALVLSGGFDGKVFVTNISRIVDNNSQSQDKKHENSVYHCGDVVGSVKWHPSDNFVASATTDNGVLHVFDIRTDQTKPAFIYGTEKFELFSHAYVDDFTVCLAYGDGSIQIHDIRNGKGIVNFKDPSQVCIGDIAFDTHNHRLAVFGVPSFSTWQLNQDETLNFYGSHTNLTGNLLGTPQNHWMSAHQTCGTLIPNSQRVLCSDSAGMLSLYELP